MENKLTGYVDLGHDICHGTMVVGERRYVINDGWVYDCTDHGDCTASNCIGRARMTADFMEEEIPGTGGFFTKPQIRLLHKMEIDFLKNQEELVVSVPFAPNTQPHTAEMKRLVVADRLHTLCNHDLTKLKTIKVNLVPITRAVDLNERRTND